MVSLAVHARSILSVPKGHVTEVCAIAISVEIKCFHGTTRQLTSVVFTHTTLQNEVVSMQEPNTIFVGSMASAFTDADLQYWGGYLAW